MKTYFRIRWTKDPNLSIENGHHTNLSRALASYRAWVKRADLTENGNDIELVEITEKRLFPAKKKIKKDVIRVD